MCVTLLTGCIMDCFGDTYSSVVFVNGTDDTILFVGVDTDGQERFRVSLAPNEEYWRNSGIELYGEIFVSYDSFIYSNGTVEWTLKREKDDRDIMPYRDLFNRRSYAKYVSSERCWKWHTYVYKFVDEDFTETKFKKRI